MLTRRPAPRPWDVIALEVLLTLATAVQVGLLLWLALATWDDRGTPGAIIGVLVVVAVAVGAGWFLWLTGVSGWLLAGASGVAGLEVAFLLVMAASGEVVGVSTGALIISLAAAILGVLCGIFLPAPSSRRYRTAPRAREVAGGPPSAPRISPGVAAAADRYAKPVVAGAAAVTAASARKVSRSSTTATGDATALLDDDPEPVLTPRPGTPIRTSGPTQPDATPATGTAAAIVATPGRGTPSAAPAPALASTPVAGTPRSAPTKTPTSATPAGGTPAMGTPAGGTPRTSTRSGAPLPDPGAIARQARASIDAELAKPTGTARPAATGTPGFRTVDPAPPATSVKRAPEPIRFSTASGRTAPPRPPRGRPVGRVPDAQQPADPGSVSPSFRSVPPASDPSAPGPASPGGPIDPPGAPR